MEDKTIKERIRTRKRRIRKGIKHGKKGNMQEQIPGIHPSHNICLILTMGESPDLTRLYHNVFTWGRLFHPSR